MSCGCGPGAPGRAGGQGRPSPWTLLDSREVYRRRLMRLREDRCRHAARGVEHRFFVLEFLDWVNVVPVTAEGELVLVRQYRAGTGSWTLEIPGGTRDEGEDPEAAARRELLEETGYGEGEWTLLGTVAPNPAIQDNRCHFYLARGVRRLAPPSPEPGEDLEVVVTGLDEALAIVEAGEFDHALGALGLLLAMRRLGREREARTPSPACPQEAQERRGIEGNDRPTWLAHYTRDMASRRGALGQPDLSEQPVDTAAWEDLNPLEFERLRQMIQRDRGDQALLALSNPDLAKALKLVVSIAGECRPTVAGLLLLGKDQPLARLVPTHEVAWQVFGDRQRVRSNDFLRWPLLRLADEVMARFRALNQEDELQVGMLRLGIPHYSEGSFREAVANALIHRDYTLLYAVHIQWHPDRIEVSNPGGLVEGVRLDNLLVTPPRPRNPVLADAFKRIGLVERTGRGIDRIFEGQLRLGRPAPDYGLTNESSVVVVLPGGPASLAFARFVHLCDREGQPLSLDDLLILNELQGSKRIDLGRARELTQKPESVARGVLENLVEAGLIEGRGEKRGRVYHLAARVYDALGQREAYARTRGLEIIRHEEMIRAAAKKYGHIQRSEAARLCGISDVSAGRLLRSLVRRGDLVQEGAGRGTYYRPPGRAKD